MSFQRQVSFWLVALAIVVWLLAFGDLFGFTGLLVAVPVSAAIGVLLRFAFQQDRARKFYTGEAR